MNETTLNAAVSSSPYDERYEMAFVYCVDRVLNHCFSLSRYPGEQEIEVMAVDQVVAKVDDLDLRLSRASLQARLPQQLVVKLHGIQRYVVQFALDEAAFVSLKESLLKIFEGKGGLHLDEENADA